jgi:hypothetical protein
MPQTWRKGPESPLLFARPAQESRLHNRRNSLARFGHRRERRHLSDKAAKARQEGTLFLEEVAQPWQPMLWSSLMKHPHGLLTEKCEWRNTPPSIPLQEA